MARMVCRNCSKDYNPTKSKADLTGYCSQRCLREKAAKLGFKKDGDLSEYKVLMTANEVGDVPYIKPTPPAPPPKVITPPAAPPPLPKVVDTGALAHQLDELVGGGNKPKPIAIPVEKVKQLTQLQMLDHLCIVVAQVMIATDVDLEVVGEKIETAQLQIMEELTGPSQVQVTEVTTQEVVPEEPEDEEDEPEEDAEPEHQVKEDKNNKPAEWHKVESTNVHSVTYNRYTSILGVRFLNGKEYHYMGIGEKVAEDMLTSKSKGTYLNRVVKPIAKEVKQMADWGPAVKSPNS